MKRKWIIAASLLAAAGVAYVQVAPQRSPGLSGMMPTGALLYLEARDLSSLLSDWDASKARSAWLTSANYSVFQQSNLYQKLAGVYTEYSSAAAFEPVFSTARAIAGANSAFALYDIRNIEFLYITELPEANVTASPVWAVRDKFERRMSAGHEFYIHTDSNRTVAFAFLNGHLFLATRDDLIARALSLASGTSLPSVGSDRWYTEAIRSAGNPGDLRMVMNLDSIVKSVYFRSYWIQRNVSDVRQFWTGVSDLDRANDHYTERRVFLRTPDQAVQSAPAPDRAALASLIATVPVNAGLYQGWTSPSASEVATLVEWKLISPKTATDAERRYAPGAASDTAAAGSEADLEVRIDEPPLPPDNSAGEVTDAVQRAFARSTIRAAMQVQSSALSQVSGFVSTPCVLAIQSASAWDANAAKAALADAINALTSQSHLGAAWATARAGTHNVDRISGLQPVYLTVQGQTLFLSNDAALLGSVLDLAASVKPGTGNATFIVGFRHARERENYARLMNALDFVQSPGARAASAEGGRVPAFFSENLASLSDVLSLVDSYDKTRSDDGSRMTEILTYNFAR